MSLSALPLQNFEELKNELEVYVDERVRFHMDSKLSTSLPSGDIVNPIRDYPDNINEGQKRILEVLDRNGERLVALEEGHIRIIGELDTHKDILDTHKDILNTHKIILDNNKNILDSLKTGQKQIHNELNNHRDRIITLEEGQKLIHSEMKALENSMLLRFEGVEKSFASVEQRFAGVEQRFDAVEQNVNQRFEGVEKSFEGVNKRIDSVELSLHRLEDKTEKQFNTVHTEFKRLDEKNGKRFSLILGACMLGFSILSALIIFIK